MSFEKVVQEVTFLLKALIGKDLYYPIQLKMNKEWLGAEGAGFYIIPQLLSEKSTIYSFGVGEDISFDEALMKNYSCHVYAYDPTPKSRAYVMSKKEMPLFHYSEFGIANYDGKTKFYLPENSEYVSCTTYNRWGYDENKIRPIEVNMKRLSTCMKENGHRSIDLLKIDIEGSEYEVVDDMLANDIKVKQLLVEVHHRFPGIGVKKTKEMISKLNKAGYLIAAISPSREEYTFVRQ